MWAPADPWKSGVSNLEPLLVYSHVPKSAGTSVASILVSLMAERHGHVCTTVDFIDAIWAGERRLMGTAKRYLNDMHAAGIPGLDDWADGPRGRWRFADPALYANMPELVPASSGLIPFHHGKKALASFANPRSLT